MRRSCCPGQPEAEWAKNNGPKAGGLLFTRAEVDAFNEVAAEIGQPAWRVEASRSCHA